MIETVGKTTELIVHNSQRSDFGRYIVTATNNSGSKAAWTRVDIVGKAHSKETKVKKCWCFIL